MVGHCSSAVYRAVRTLATRLLTDERDLHGDCWHSIPHPHFQTDHLWVLETSAELEARVRSLLHTPHREDFFATCQIVRIGNEISELFGRLHAVGPFPIPVLKRQGFDV